MHAQSLPGQHPPPQTHSVSCLVVARDGDVHIGQRTVCVTQSTGGQVNLKHLRARLGVSSGISNHRKSWVLKGCQDLVTEDSRSEVASGSSKLQHCSLAAVALTEAGFTMTPTARAVSRSFSQVVFRFTI